MINFTMKYFMSVHEATKLSFAMQGASAEMHWAIEACSQWTMTGIHWAMTSKCVICVVHLGTGELIHGT